MGTFRFVYPQLATIKVTFTYYHQRNFSKDTVTHAILFMVSRESEFQVLIENSSFYIHFDVVNFFGTKLAYKKLDLMTIIAQWVAFSTSICHATAAS